MSNRIQFKESQTKRLKQAELTCQRTFETLTAIEHVSLQAKPKITKITIKIQHKNNEQ